MLRSRDAFDTVLKTLRADSSIEFGVRGARIEVLRTVEGPFSTIRRVRIRTPERTTHAYIKILKPRRPGDDELVRIDRMLRREHQATLAVYETLHQDDGIGAVRPLACLPEYRVLVTEEVPGRPFSDLLAGAQSSSPELEAIAERIGRWVRMYQWTSQPPAGIALANQRQYLDDRLVLLEGRVLSRQQRHAVLDRFDSLAAHIGTRLLPAVPIHADFTPTNLIVDERGRLTVLDFTMAKAGTPHHDLSHLYFHLELLSVRHRHKQAMVRALQEAMLRGYDPALSAADPLFRLMLLQHGVCHVALLAERRVPLVDRAYRWFLRRRWHTCEQMPEGQPELRVA